MSIHAIPRAYDENQHKYVAEQLQKKLNWIGPQYGFLESGTLPDGTICHVMVKIPLWKPLNLKPKKGIWLIIHLHVDMAKFSIVAS